MTDTQIKVITVSAQEWNETKGMIKSLFDKVSRLTDKEEKELLTPKEVCEMLKIGRTTFDRHIANGVLEQVKVKHEKYRKIYVRRADVERLINDETI